jgi:quinol monooxygenase YgiN
MPVPGRIVAFLVLPSVVDGQHNRTPSCQKRGEPMAVMFVRHKVADFAAWKKVYDTAGRRSQEAGSVLEEKVYRDPDDPNTVIVIHKFQDIDTARKFANLDTLKQAMQQAGVQETPTFWFGEEVE